VLDQRRATPILRCGAWCRRNPIRIRGDRSTRVVGTLSAARRARHAWRPGRDRCRLTPPRTRRGVCGNTRGTSSPPPGRGKVRRGRGVAAVSQGVTEVGEGAAKEHQSPPPLCADRHGAGVGRNPQKPTPATAQRSTVRHGSAQRSAPEHPRTSRSSNGRFRPHAPNRGRPIAPKRGRQQRCDPVQGRSIAARRARSSTGEQYSLAVSGRGSNPLGRTSTSPPADVFSRAVSPHSSAFPAREGMPPSRSFEWRRSLRRGSPPRRRRSRSDTRPIPRTAHVSTVRRV
jgi:hypothetical protein